MSVQLNITQHDVDMMLMGDTMPVEAGPVLRSNGWRGGSFVAYATGDGRDFTVELSDGVVAVGFLLFPSEGYPPTTGGDPHQNFTAYQYATAGVTAAASGASVLTMIAGGGRYLFNQFETTALVGAGTRTGAAITYALNDELKVSENGLLCNDSDANLLTATGGASTVFVGYCCVPPTANSGNKIGVDLKF
jgi:hypothetical protein